MDKFIKSILGCLSVGLLAGCQCNEVIKSDDSLAPRLVAPIEFADFSVIGPVTAQGAEWLMTKRCKVGSNEADGHLIESPYWLVRPPEGHGWFRDDFIECHGLTHLDVMDAAEFPAIAPELLDHLTRADLVIAHNAAFDIGHLRETLDHFGLPRPEFDYVCTCQLARHVWPELPSHGLHALAAHIGHEFNHHHAQSDAEAAGRVLLAMMKQVNASTPRELLQNAAIVPKPFCP